MGHDFRFRKAASRRSVRLRRRATQAACCPASGQSSPTDYAPIPFDPLRWWGRSADLGHSRGGGGACPTRGHIHAVVRTPNGNDGKDLLHHKAHAHDPGHGHRQPFGIRVARHRTQRLNET
ncbi:MAG: hypothetical protein EOS39_15005 [Mesorhizobium sp.]|nr:MAG: hypothetical protein EOS39_15005 [Mesorhizobium sp.]TIV55120.1 MAG: hypothetical protein E5V88_02605 [Mesorhizobium sp.]